jgi:hypothetical protein
MENKSKNALNTSAGNESQNVEMLEEKVEILKTKCKEFVSEINELKKQLRNQNKKSSLDNYTKNHGDESARNVNF